MSYTTVNAIEIPKPVVTEAEHNNVKHRDHADLTPRRIVFRISDDHKVITNHFVAPNVHTSSFSHNFESQVNRLVRFAKVAIYLTKIRIFSSNSI